MNKKQFFTLGAALTLLTGCAVLTVDVDVYTGPLANTEEVQTEQVISLVMGAKPLLVQLRDHLEVSSWGTHAVKTGKALDLISRQPSLQEELAVFRDQDWYWTGFVSPSHLKNEHALRVNDVLVLYDDRLPDGLAALLSRGREIYQRYQSSYEVLFPTNNYAERQAWTTIQGGFARSTDKSTRMAYEVFLVSDQGHRVTGPLMTELVRNYSFQVSRADTRVLNAEHVMTIRKEGLVRSEAERLFGAGRLDTEAAKQFIRQCDRLLLAHDECQAAWSELTALALTGLQQIKARMGTFASPADYEYVRDTVAGFAATLLAVQGKDSAKQRAELERNLLSDDAARRIAEIQQAAPPPLSLEQARLPGDLKEELAYIMRAADSVLNDGRQPQGLETLIDEYLIAATNAANRTFAARSQMPEFTKLMDGLVAFGSKVSVLGNAQVLLENVSHAEARKYVSVLQYVGNAVVVHTDELKRRSQHQRDQRHRRSTTAAALRDGGLSRQLPAAWDTEAAKFTFTAKDALERVIVALRAEYAAALYQGAGTDPAKTKLAVEAAKSVRDQAQHAKNLADQEVTDAGPATAKKQAAEAKLAALRAHLEGSLKLLAQAEAAHTLASAQTGNPSAVPPASRVDHIQQAIQAVTTMREGNIYLRPASAYLRSSYPATTLNLNESVGWNNQLERQAWRAVPIVGELLDYGGRARLKELRELDKHSWQNINRVRLHGAGNANYAVTKDDIGNWYVKSYSADPSDVIRATRNVALMAAGGTFGGKLPIIGKDGQALLATNSPLNLQYEKALAVHMAATTNKWSALTNAVMSGEFITNAISSWATNPDFTADDIAKLAGEATAAKHTDKLVNAVEKSKSAMNATVSQPAEERLRVAEAQILAVLQAVKTYRAGVLPGFAKTLPAVDKRSAAEQAFTGKIRDFLQGVIRDRNGAIDRFEATVQVIQSGTGN